MPRILTLLITALSVQTAFSQTVEYRLAPAGQFQLTESDEDEVKVEKKSATVVIGKDGKFNINKLPSGTQLPYQNMLRGMLIGTDPSVAGGTITLTVPDSTTRELLKLPKDAGVVVEAIVDEGEKKRLGLAIGDIILKINDKAATSEDVVKEELKAENIAIRIVRKGEETELKPEPKKKPTKKRYLLGVRLGELEPVVRSQMGLDDYVNVVVMDVTEDSAAKESGIQANDILLAINSDEATGAEMVQKAIQKSKGEPVEVKVLRDGEEVTVEVKPKLVETPVEAATITVDGHFTNEWNQIYQLPDHAAKGSMYWYHAPNQMSAGNTQKKLQAIDKKLDELKAAIEELKALQQDK